MIKSFKAEPTDMHRIFSRDPKDKSKGTIYIATLVGARDVENLKAHGINCVLSVMHKMETEELSIQYPSANILHKNIEIWDHIDPEISDISQYFGETFEYIHLGLDTGNVLVHCYYGQSRSCTITIAYLIKAHKMSYKNAYDLVKKQREKCDPNPSFVKMLKAYELKFKDPKFAVVKR